MAWIGLRRSDDQDSAPHRSDLRPSRSAIDECGASVDRTNVSCRPTQPLRVRPIDQPTLNRREAIAQGRNDDQMPEKVRVYDAQRREMIENHWRAVDMRRRSGF